MPEDVPQQKASTSISEREEAPQLCRATTFGPWKAIYNEGELHYFRHKDTGERKGKDDLFAGWERLEDEHNRTYFHHTLTGNTSWQPPDGYYEWMEEQELVKIRGSVFT